VFSITVHKMIVLTDVKELFIIIQFQIVTSFTLTNTFYSQDSHQILHIIQVKNICVLDNENANIILFYTQSDKTTTLCLSYHCENELFTHCVLL
ncbi:hypothetical protein EMPG_13564, partial [Blastomyces silverae]